MKNKLLKYFQIINHSIFIETDENNWLANFKSVFYFATYFMGFVFGILSPFKELLGYSNSTEFIYFQVIPFAMILGAFITWRVVINRSQFLIDFANYKAAALTLAYKIFGAAILMLSILLNIYTGVKHGVVVVLVVTLQLLIYPYLFYLVSKIIQKYDLYDKKSE